MPSPLRIAAIAILLVPLAEVCGGCLLTGPMWDQARSRMLKYPDIAGTASAEKGAAPSALVVRYAVAGGESNRELFVLVPLSADGTPVAPFAGGRVTREVDEFNPAVAQQIPPNERRHAQEVRFTPDDFSAGARARRSRTFRPVHAASCGIGVMPLLSDEPAILAYWPSELGSPPPPRRFPYYIPPGANVVMLPTAQPRPKRDRDADIVTAAALTPLTLAGDIVLTPLYLLLLLGGGGC